MGRWSLPNCRAPWVEEITMHPYTNQPDRNFWRRFVSDTRWSALDFVGQPKFTLAPEARVSAAGSCFAQHINRHMRMRGLSPFQSEHANTLVANEAAEVASHTAFSARYGNIYSSRQCLELFQQAFGERPVAEDFVEQEGRYYDLLRPMPYRPVLHRARRRRQTAISI
jgi:hypothetical protein